MTDWYDVGQWKESRNGKRWFIKLGSAKKDDKTDGFVIFMDALPLQDSAGRCTLNIQPQRERGAGGNFGAKQSNQDDPMGVPF